MQDWKSEIQRQQKIVCVLAEAAVHAAVMVA